MKNTIVYRTSRPSSLRVELTIVNKKSKKLYYLHHFGADFYHV